ncbi:MAG: hypothetical protein MUD03_07120 [Pirellula sp.]|nr:hypothetical protein [Pirellula sp.]
MIRLSANNRSNALASAAGMPSSARLPRVGAVVVLLIFLLQPQKALATCGDYLQHREGRVPHFANSSQGLFTNSASSNDTTPSEPTCSGGQCRSRLPAPVVPSDFLTKLARLRDSFDSVSFRKGWSEDYQAGVLRVSQWLLPSVPSLDVPVPPPRFSFSS